ncbi:MAG: hypothetical protein HWN66_12565 [Candidatus Helarchaeota archaeon]|nr:hypothetical protein [Candidatus Helarchaeota archaeon]
MGFGIAIKNCAKCCCEFSIHDDRVNYCKDCYLDEFELLEELAGGLDEKQA